eukprot:s2445_g9.t1
MKLVRCRSLLHLPRQWQSWACRGTVQKMKNLHLLHSAVPEPEHKPDGASVSVLEAQEGEKDEEDERCGSEADVEDPPEALGHVSPESEMEAAWRAACADGAPGQDSDSDVQIDTSVARLVSV